MDLFKELQTNFDNIQPIGEDVATNNQQRKKIGDIEFLKKLSNFGIPFDNRISNRSASNLVQQAHDSAEEVDTVAFGLELNDGEVVKVYVNAEQADDFEKAMADILGQEDDVEDAIDKMGQTFDIVSVEWPENRKAAAMNASSLDNENGETPASVVAPAVDSEGSSAQPFHKVKVDFDLGELAKKPEGEGEETDAPEDKDKKKNDDGIELDDAKDDKEDDGANFDVEDDIAAKDDKEDDSEETDDEEELDKNGKPKKKKKKDSKDKAEKPVAERLSIGARVKARFLNEASDKVEPKETIKSSNKKSTEEETKTNEPIDHSDDQDVKLEDIFKTPMQRKLFRLISLFDFPTQRLIAHKQDLRANLRSSAIELMSNNKAKIFLDKLIAELESVRDMDLIHNNEKKVIANHKKSDLKEQDETQTEKIEVLLKIIFKILKNIGIPNAALDVRHAQLKQQMRPLAKELLKHAKVQMYLHSFAKAIGIDDGEEEVTEEVNLGTNKYLQLVSALLTELGVPDDNLNFQKANLIQSLRNKTLKIDIGRVKPRLVQLIQTLQQTTTVTEDAKIFAKEHAAKLGNWSITQMNKSITLSVEDVAIELNDSQTKKLVEAINAGDQISVNGFKFVPISTGAEYIVYSDTFEDYSGGILFTAKSVRNLTKLFNV